MLIKFITYLSVEGQEETWFSFVERLTYIECGWVVEVVIRINWKMPIELDRISWGHEK